MGATACSQAVPERPKVRDATPCLQASSGTLPTPHPRPLSPEYRGEGGKKHDPLSPEYRGEGGSATPGSPRYKEKVFMREFFEPFRAAAITTVLLLVAIAVGVAIANRSACCPADCPCCDECKRGSAAK